MTQADFERAYGRTKARLRLMLTVTLVLAALFGSPLLGLLLAQYGHPLWGVVFVVAGFIVWLFIVTSDGRG